ncbi:hypothetical protein QUF72_18970 [Desulfobacterales bacterium HSG2]|nr:hypothetical protein [Desulfobacterales bacterium HSG2]
MSEKYDLNKMLEEIREDEQFANPKKKEMSQDMISKMMIESLKRKKERKEKG